MILGIVLVCWQLCGLAIVFYSTSFSSTGYVLESLVAAVLVNLCAALWPAVLACRLYNGWRAERERKFKAVRNKLRG